MNDELNEKDNNQRGPIETELQVRLMNLVLGEASDFERDQLQLLMEQRPELAAYENHLMHLHGLLCEVGAGELSVDAPAASDEVWQLPADRRNQLLAVLDGETSSSPSLVASSSLTTKAKKPKSRRYAAALVLATAACVMMGLMLPTFQLARESARRYQVAASDKQSGFAASLPTPYYMKDDVQYLQDDSGSMDGRAMTDRVMAGKVMSRAEAAAPAATATDKSAGPQGLGWGPAESNDILSDSNFIDLQNRVDLTDGEHTKHAVDPKLLRAAEPAGPRAEDRVTERFALEMPKTEPEPWYDSSKAPQEVALGVAVPQFASPTDEKGYTVQAPDDGTLLFGGIKRRASGGRLEQRFGDQAAKSDSDPALALVTPRMIISDEEPGINGIDAPYEAFGTSGRDRAPIVADDWKKLAQDYSEINREQSSSLQSAKVPSGESKAVRGFEQLDELSIAQGQVSAGKKLQEERKQIEDEQLEGQIAKQESELEVLESVGQHDARAKGKANLSRESVGKDKDTAWDINAPTWSSAPEGIHWRYIPAPSPEVIAAKERVSVFEAKPADVDYYAKPAAPKPAKPAAQPVAAIDEQSAVKEAFSTFSLHVSDVSFKLAQTALSQGQWPEAAKIRIEEFVNAMNYHDPLPAANERVACRVEQAIHPFLMQRNLLRISMRTSATGRSQNTPLRLTLVLDNSGSMERPDRRQAVLRAFEALIAQLKPTDQVTLISFANQPRLLADKVAGDQGQSLLQVIETLPSEGGTNIEAALLLAREKATEQKLAGAENRIVLLTDGAVNLGDADPDSLSKLVTQLRDSGIAFDAAGISAVDLNDEVLEALTRQGDGRYYLLDSAEEVSQGFAAQLAGALRPSAQNVKVQVEFNPDRVGRYKLLGFEKHRLNKEDFRNDQVDAAELAAAEAGVAVYQYEIKPNGSGDIGNVSVRFRDLSTGQMVERRWPIPYETSTPRLEQAQASMRVAAAAAFFAAKLGGGPLADSVDLVQLQKLVTGLPDEFAQQPRVVQLRTMIEQAQGLNK